MHFHFGDIILRTSLGFLILLVSSRVLGKQLIAKMTYYDFVSHITLGSLAGALILDHRISLGDLVLAISMFTLLCLISSFLSLKNLKMRRIIGGTSTELIRDGKILEKELEHARISVEALVQKLRVKGVFELSTVKQAFLEADGALSVLLIPEARPMTVGDYKQQQLPAERLPVELIIDGVVQSDKLTASGLDLAWLMQEISKRGVADTTEIAYAVLTSKNTFYIDKYNDDLTIPPRTNG